MQKPSTTIHDYSTRRKRRFAMTSIISALEQISLAEEIYMMKMPINLQESVAYETTEYYVFLIDEALDSLRSVYDD
jgi:hypothetical protein